MYIKIVNSIITSYSKTKMDSGLYTDSEGLNGGFLVTEQTNTGVQNELGEDIYIIVAEDPSLIEKIITIKLERLKKINQEVLDLGGSNILVGIESYDIKRLAKIEELTAESEIIKTELGEYEPTLVESIVDVIFG